MALLDHTVVLFFGNFYFFEETHWLLPTSLGDILPEGFAGHRQVLSLCEGQVKAPGNQQPWEQLSTNDSWKPLKQGKGDVLSFFLFRAVPAAYGVPRIGIGLEPQPPACTTSRSMLDP